MGYTWAVGDAGFGKVWQDGNNEDDLKAWGTRIRQRIKKFANDSEAHIVLAHALGMHNASFSHQNEILDQIKSFIEIGIQEKVWTENDQNKNNELIKQSSDFYSLSSVRDLLFHVQENTFTISEIENNIKELNLKFCGFENKEIINKFKKIYPKNEDLYNLSMWNDFENKNKRVFAGMYQFWCQKI